jgi:hypothetical protein
MREGSRVSVLVVAHDSGGAEVVSAWVKRQAGNEFSYLLDGPAVNIFRRKLGTLPICKFECVTDCVRSSDWVLTATGWGSDLEKHVIEIARRENVRVVSYLDHWTSYQERFQLDGRLILPNEIWTGDRYAHELAQAAFPGHPVRLVPNLYFEEMLQQIEASTLSGDRTEKIRILYVTEPISVVAAKKHGDPRFWGYTEFEALEGYLDYLCHQAVSVEEIILRSHPSEPAGKYVATIEKYRDRFRIAESHQTLVQDCARADWIVGCDSMAMVIGVLAAKKVFCCIPKGGPPPSLPYPEIVRLFP